MQDAQRHFIHRSLGTAGYVAGAVALAVGLTVIYARTLGQNERLSEEKILEVLLRLLIAPLDLLAGSTPLRGAVVFWVPLILSGACLWSRRFLELGDAKE